MMDVLVQDAALVRSVPELGRLLRALRHRHARHSRDSELSYRELAARTGWSHAAIAEYLTGRTLPPTDRLDGLMRVLGATAGELGAIATARDRVEELRRSGRATKPSPGNKVGDGAGGDPPGVPRQLPAVPPHFVGRAAELAALSDLADRPPEPGMVLISAVAGMAGIGKTALAVQAGHRLASCFPDGQVFVDLHGFTAGVARVQPAQALERLLRDVGVPGERIPSGLQERAALWRSVLAGRRMLVVLDNAATEGQVQPLLPGASGCLVLVTSRRRLIGLETTHAVSLDTLPQADAVTLFLRTADRPELTIEAPDVLNIVELCGRLPLAIRIAAARLKHRRAWTVLDLMARLRVIAGLAAFDDGQRSIHATLHLSYQYLSADAQRVYRLLGLHPGPDVDAYAAAALTAGTPDEVRRLLDGLVDDHMLQEPRPGRFQFHDLVRAHAADIAVERETQPQRHAALSRLLDHYRRTAASAMVVAYPYERQRRPTVPPALTPTPDLDDQSQALRWLDTELANVLAAAQHAAQCGWPEHAWHLSATLNQHLLTRGRYRDMQTLHQQALKLANHLGNPRAQIDALNSLGSAERILGSCDQAGDHYGQALQIAREIGDRPGEMQALTGLGFIHRMLGRHDQAFDQYGQALQIARDIGDRAGELQALNGLGQIHYVQGRYEPASDHLWQALQIAQDIGDRLDERQALIGLGHVDRTLGSYEQAGDRFGRALQIAQDIGERVGELNALNAQGHIERLLGRYEAAGDHHKQALQIAQDIGDRIGELYALNSLGELHGLLGHHNQAVSLYQQALDLARDLDRKSWQFEALQGLGRLHHATGHPDLALTHHEQALQFATDLGQPTDQARAHDGLAHAHHALNQRGQARHHWQHALDILTRLGTDHTDEIEASLPNIRAHLTNLDQQHSTILSLPRS